MVNSYQTSLAEGSISPSNRPQSAHSRKRIDTGETSPGVKVFANSLYEAGDILAGQPDFAPAAKVQAVPPQPPPMSPLTSGGSQKLQQQRALAAQKRMERLQLGGLAQSNDTIAVVGIGSGRPGTPKTARLADPSSAPAAGMVPVPPGGAASGSRSYRARADGQVEYPGPWQGSTQQSQPGPPGNKFTTGSYYDPEEDLEVETLDEPAIRPGTASAACANSSSSGGQAGLKQPQPAIVHISDVGTFLRSPAPPNSAGVVMCCIERLKAGVGKPPIYRFHLELPNGGFRFLLAARKRLKTATSSYIISTSADDLGRHSSCCIAKLRSNFVGTGFSILAVNGSNASSATSSRPISGGLQATSSPQRQVINTASSMQPQAGGRQQLSNSSSRSSSGRPTRDMDVSAWSGPAGMALGQPELGAVMYEYNVLGTRGPRRMSAAVPALDDAGNSCWVPTGPQDSISDRLRSGGTPGDQLIILKNKAPKWNDTLNAYCLNFNGRVTEASVKNFQLVATDDPETVVLQFGKVSDSCFTCDFNWPLNPLQAFCICLSSFDNKLACE